MKKELFVKDGKIASEMDHNGVHPVLYLNDVKGDSFTFLKTETTPPNRSRTGYGRKIPTQYVVIDNHSGRRRRVYAICYSNAASLYVLIGGIMYFVRDSDIPEAIPSLDKRYSVQLEYCGHEKPYYVLRFCGEFISSHHDRAQAYQAQSDHEAKRRGTP